MTAILAALLLAAACLLPAPAVPVSPDVSSALIAASEHAAGNQVQWPAQEQGEPTGDQLEGSEAP